MLRLAPPVQSLPLDAELVRRFDLPGPRYTSYPTADRFVEAFDSEAYARARATKGLGRLPGPAQALYIHIPFCANVCFYCGCNRIITRDTRRATQYVQYVIRELALQAHLLGERSQVGQMHWGGGTPTFLQEADLAALVGAIEDYFSLTPDAERCIEVDPRATSVDKVRFLGDLGFNRVSIGVQDFDGRVQAAINRVQPESLTRAVVDAARAAGFRSINLDLIYGLPYQSRASFSATLDRLLQIAPDRVALYGYAHLPERFKAQRRIAGEALPTAQERIAIMLMAIERLTAAGYVAVGIDHFAKPDDDLAQALMHGRLQRNFQGYSALPDGDLIGIGASAIGKTGVTYSQNMRDLNDYYAALDCGKLPIQRGIELTADDLLRRAVIMALMCQFAVSKEAISAAHLVDFERYFDAELKLLRPLEEAGLVVVDREWIEVTERGRLLVRAVAMVFDRYLRTRIERTRYSRVI